jgi:hypothetical protein
LISLVCPVPSPRPPQGLSPLKNTDGYFLLQCGSHLALQKLPLTGSPHHALARLANPRGVGSLLLSPAGKHAFTINKEDECVQQWDIDPLVLEVGLEPSTSTAQNTALTLHSALYSALH